MELIIKGLENFEVAMQMLIPNMWQEENLPFQIFTFGNPPNLWATHTHIYIYISSSQEPIDTTQTFGLYISSFHEPIDIPGACREPKNRCCNDNIDSKTKSLASLEREPCIMRAL